MAAAYQRAPPGYVTGLEALRASCVASVAAARRYHRVDAS